MATPPISEMQPNGLDIRILGSVEFEQNGEIVAIGGGRNLRVLARLLLGANTTVAVDDLLETTWESPPRSARQQIHNAIAAIRRSCQSTTRIAIVSDSAGYQLQVDPHAIDLIRFRSAVTDADRHLAGGDKRAAIDVLESARALWRGPALSGLGGRYFAAQVARLQDEYMTAVEILTVTRAESDTSPQVISELMELVSAHPFRETFRHALMTALDRFGRTVEALDVYEEGRRRLADELGIDPSRRLQNVYVRILKGLSPTPATEETPAPAALAPREAASRNFLPYGPQDFVGRKNELDQLVAGARGPGTSLVISAVGGMGGIGKTALALQFAWSHLSDFPDGQYFVDLRGFTPGADPLPPSDALDLLLRQRGVPEERIPLHPDAKSSLWRSEMTGQRAIIVLDNALNRSHVGSLLPGGDGPMVLVTSRRRLAEIDGAVPSSLDLMPRTDAERMFTRIVGVTDQRLADTAPLAETVELCGRLPLAIRIAAARFRHRQSWSLSHLNEQLADQRRRMRFFDHGERSLFDALSLSYRHLACDEQVLFRMLGIHPGDDFDAASAATLAGIPVERAEECLEVLLDYHLLVQERPARFRFHGLVRDSARRLSEETDAVSDREAALRRVLDHYYGCAMAWCGPLAKGPFQSGALDPHAPEVVPPTSIHDSKRILDDERTNLVSAAKAALEVGDTGKAWRFVCALQPMFGLQNYAQPAEQLLMDTLELVRTGGDQRGETVCLTALALVSRERQENSRAIELLNTALEISRALGDRLLEAHQLSLLGETCHLDPSV